MAKELKNKNLITKNTFIGDMVSKYPKTADIMLSWGLACVGCSINVFESVEEGARVHGQMKDKEIEKLVIELNSVAKPIKKYKLFDSFYITKRALDEIVKSAKKEKKDNYGLSLSVIEEDGDKEYELEFKKKKKANQEEFIIKNISFYIDNTSKAFLENTVLDYINTPLQEGFKFDKLESID
jgi:hybrid cluster-associated redox disulfide protein